jgi:hypothetical protein
MISGDGKPSKIGAAGGGDGIEAKIEFVIIVRRTGVFGHASVRAISRPSRAPGFVERTRIIDCEGDVQRLAPVDCPEALDNMFLRRVRCAIAIDKSHGVQAYCIDDQRVAFVRADRFAVP